MRRTRGLPVWIAALVLVGACASDPGKGRDARWVRSSDGSPAADADVERARESCLRVPTESVAGGDRFAYYEYAERFLDCMQERGFLLVEADSASK